MQYDLTFERKFKRLGPDGTVAIDHFANETKSNLGLDSKRETTYSYPDVLKTDELDEERFRLSA